MTMITKFRHCVVSACVGTGLLAASAVMPAYADDAKPAAATPAAACDPYKDYSCLDSYLGTGIWERLTKYYALEMGQGAAPVDPKAPPSRRPEIPPQPQTVPPMPFTEWPYGGNPAVGAAIPGATDSPLLVAIANTSFGQWMAANNIQTYGWIDVGYNASTSTVHGGNAPAAYLYNPNAFDLNQIVQYFERVPDEVQKDHNDWGFRISGIYGSDYRYTTAYGLGSYQLIDRNRSNGWDAPMLYVDWYTPFVGNGLNIRVGRFIAVPDIEAQLAPNNYMYTHSMTYTFDNYTTQGIIGTYMLTKNTILQAGLIAGTEATPDHLWQTLPNTNPNLLYPNTTFKRDPGARPAGVACVRYTSDSANDDLNVCADGINGAEWGYNNLQWFGMTYYHKIDDHWHFDVELYQEHQNKVPNLNNAYVQGIVAAGAGTPFSPNIFAYNAPNMAWCSKNNTTTTAANLTCTSRSTGLAGYLNYSPDALNNFSFRPEIYRDPQGQRTGTPTTYHNVAVGWQHWLSPQVEFRPELAYYHASVAAFNGNANAVPVAIAPNKNSETILSGDVIFHW